MARNAVPPDILKWLTVRQAARLLGVSAEKVRLMGNNNEITFVTMPNGRLYDPAEVNQLAKEYAAKRRGRE